MSHHTKIATRITNPDAAGDALRDLFPQATVDVDHNGNLCARLYGTQRAEGCVAVARSVGRYKEDVAIVRGSDGICSLQADVHTIEHWQRTHGRTMPVDLSRRAAYHTIMRYARTNGLDVVSEQRGTVTAGRVG